MAVATIFPWLWSICFNILNDIMNTLESAKGVYPIAVTPFQEDGTIDFDSLDRLTEFFLECGVPGITFLGLLGEASKLSPDESQALLRRVTSRIKTRAQVIVGTSHVGFDNLRRFVGNAMDAGASGIMVAPGSGLYTEDRVIAYFEALVREIGEDVAIALQDYPQHTGVYMSAATVGKLVKQLPSIGVVKHEEASALRKVTQLRSQEASGYRRRVSVLVGNSGIHLPQELHRGVDGANTGVAFPEMLVEVCRRFFAGHPEEAEDMYDIFLPLIRHEQQPGIGLALRKEIFRRRGLISSAKTRAPGPSLDGDDHAELKRMLARLKKRLSKSGESGVIRSYQL